MGTLLFSKRTKLRISADDAFKWYQRPGIFRRLTPPWMNVNHIEGDNGIEKGNLLKIHLCLGFLKRCMRFICSEFKESSSFTVIQRAGPFKLWIHQRIFRNKDQGESYIEDRIKYSLPFSLFGDWLLGKIIQKKLSNIIRYQHEIVKKDVMVSSKKLPEKATKVLLVGGSGMIGEALKIYLITQGFSIQEVSHKKRPDCLYWNKDNKEFDASALQGIYAVIYLGGEPILSRWDEDKKDLIHKSRIERTQALINSLIKADILPKVFICASGINYYGTQRTERLHEKSKSGEGFLAELCQEWELASKPLQEKGVRVINMRLGAVLSPNGGALKMMLPFFKLGLGGRLGSGHQYMSWVSIDDVVDVIYFCMMDKNAEGAINVTAPSPCTNFKFKQTLSELLNRPAWFPVPKFILTLFFGEMAKETILSSLKVYPHKLLALGYKFRYPKLKSALKHLIGR